MTTPIRDIFPTRPADRGQITFARQADFSGPPPPKVSRVWRWRCWAAGWFRAVARWVDPVVPVVREGDVWDDWQ